MIEHSSGAAVRPVAVRRSTAGLYALALTALAAAVLLRFALDPWMGDSLPLVTLFGAVAAAVWIGGYRPAILVTILGYVVCHLAFIQPRGRFDLGLEHAVGLSAYFFTCAIIISLGEAVRRAQVRAKDRGETLRVTLRSIGDGVITTDVGGRVVSINDVAESLSGWTRDEAVGQPLDAVFRIVNEDTRAPVDNPATRALRDGVIVGLANHTVLIRKDGSECPIDDSAAPIRNEQGVVTGCVLIFRDVSDQRRIQRDKASQLITARLLASIIESSDDAIISKSLDGVIQTWNAAAERLFGYPAEQAIGRHISLVIPPERLAEEDHIIASLKAGRRIEHFETERVRSDGRRIFVSLTVSPIKDATGQVVGASKIVRDFTERRQLEDHLRSLAADLSEADRRKNEFLAMLAHELRNPLAPISNAARALRISGRDEQSLRSASEMLERQVAQMARLVDDLLDMSRITRGKIELRKERIELAPIIHQAVEAVRSQYRSMNHELTVTLPTQPVYLDADPARLAQVVGNLLNNACKFTDRGGRVSLIVEPGDDEVVVRVRDNGIGISAEHLPRLFEMFAQVDTSLERSRDGLGLGLTLVKTLVELHDGTVHAHSDGPGRGSEFTLRLPTAAETAPAAEPSAIRTAPATGRRILIVDDNEDGAESLAMLLTFGGHETHMAHDGRQAIEAAERLRPDAVLLDIGLPLMNGYEVCRRIRSEPWGKHLTMVALTGWGQDEDRHRSTEAGFDAHMVKPVNHDLLLKLLDSLPVEQPSERT
jgi:PAS domain S-box-containing protein